MKYGLVEPASSERASNVVIVKKSDKSLRLCVDYRQLNARTIKDAYPTSAWMPLRVLVGFRP